MVPERHRTWNGTTWTQTQPGHEARVHEPACRRPTTRRVGYLCCLVVRAGGHVDSSDTWTGNITPERASNSGAHVKSASPSCWPGWHPVRNRGQVVLFGGLDLGGGIGIGDTWTWNGTTWTASSVALGLGAHRGPTWGSRSPPASWCCLAASATAVLQRHLELRSRGHRDDHVPRRRADVGRLRQRGHPHRRCRFVVGSGTDRLRDLLGHRERDHHYARDRDPGPWRSHLLGRSAGCRCERDHRHVLGRRHPRGFDEHGGRRDGGRARRSARGHPAALLRSRRIRRRLRGPGEHFHHHVVTAGGMDVGDRLWPGVRVPTRRFPLERHARPGRGVPAGRRRVFACQRGVARPGLVGAGRGHRIRGGRSQRDRDRPSRVHHGTRRFQGFGRRACPLLRVHRSTSMRSSAPARRPSRPSRGTTPAISSWCRRMEPAFRSRGAGRHNRSWAPPRRFRLPLPSR